MGLERGESPHLPPEGVKGGREEREGERKRKRNGRRICRERGKENKGKENKRRGRRIAREEKDVKDNDTQKHSNFTDTYTQCQYSHVPETHPQAQHTAVWL